MKKNIVICLFALAVLVIFIYACMGLLQKVILSEPNIIQESISPDGKYVAYVYKCNGGATTRFDYRLSVLKNGVKLKSGKKDIYISYTDLKVYWVDDKKLMVNNVPQMDIFKQKNKVYDITVEYKYTKGTDFMTSFDTNSKN